jgi:hypothetical protein
MILRPIFLDKGLQVIKKKHFQKFLHGSTLKVETQTFSCDKPLSALFLLTDSPPGNVSLLPENRIELIKNYLLPLCQKIRRARLAQPVFFFSIPMLNEIKYHSETLF